MLTSIIIVAIIILIVYLYNYEGYIVKEDNTYGMKYYVKNLQNSEEAADILAYINKNIVKLVRHLKSKYGKNHQNVKCILDRYNPNVLYEHIPNSFDSSVAYTIRKGKSLYICIRDEDGNFHPMNVIMFVALHELSHIATDAQGHPEEFWRVFNWILREAVEINIYNPINYEKKPKKYCGDMIITYNPLYDPKFT